MNIMRDMTQFVVVVLVLDETLATLAENFTQQVLLQFGIYHLIIIDDGSPFKFTFIAMNKSLNINHDTLAKRNHTYLLIEKFYRFINKVITIVGEDRGKNDIFVAAGVATGYAWNSSLIDRTNILCRVIAIGRELRFPLDIDLSTLPTLVSKNVEAVVSYLRLTYSNRYFASAILKFSSKIAELLIQKELIIVGIL